MSYAAQAVERFMRVERDWRISEMTNRKRLTDDQVIALRDWKPTGICDRPGDIEILSEECLARGREREDLECALDLCRHLGVDIHRREDGHGWAGTNDRAIEAETTALKLAAAECDKMAEHKRKVAEEWKTQCLGRHQDLVDQALGAASAAADLAVAIRGMKP